MTQNGGTIWHLSDTLIELRGPTDQALGTPITGATVTARLYDEDWIARMALAETVCAVDNFTDATLKIPILTPAIFEVGDSIIVELRDTTLRLRQQATRTILSVGGDSQYDFLDLNTAFTANNGCDAGTKVWLKKKAFPGGPVFVPVSRQPFPQNLTPFDPSIEITYDGGTFDVQTQLQPPIQVIAWKSRTEALPWPSHQILPTAMFLVPSAALSVGSRIRRKLGGDISMAQYGTPVAYGKNWGYRGTIQQNHEAAKILGAQVLVEITFAGGGLDAVETFSAAVVRK